MSTSEEIEKILSEPMTRKQFLRHIGLIVLGLVGVNALLSRLIHPEKHLAGSKASKDWGNGKYGA